MKRAVRIFSPFLLLILILVWVNWDWSPPEDVPSEVIGDVMETAVPPTATATLPPTITPFPTQTPLPTPTPYIAPVFPATATIELIGPPSNATFTNGHEVSFYWQWTTPLTSGQQFVLYGVTSENPLPLATINETYLGNQYVASVSLPETPLTGWFVQLETNLADVVLMNSEQRPLTINE